MITPLIVLKCMYVFQTQVCFAHAAVNYDDSLQQNLLFRDLSACLAFTSIEFIAVVPITAARITLPFYYVELWALVRYEFSMLLLYVIIPRSTIVWNPQMLISVATAPKFPILPILSL